MALGQQRWRVSVWGCLALATMAQAQDATLEEQLQAQYRLTTLTADSAGIATAGSALTLRRGGFSAGAASNRVPSRNNYKDGQIRPEIPGVFNKCALCKSIPGADRVNAQMGPVREFVAGENLYVTKISVDRAKDTITFSLVSDPSVTGGLFKGSLAFSYSKGSLSAADLRQVQGMIGEVFRTAPVETLTPAVSALPRPSPVTAQPQAALPQLEIPPAPQASAQAETPLPQLDAPPPLEADVPAPAMSPKTVVSGQTMEQVTAILGRPLSAIAGSGNREVYQYQYVRIVFVNGKVTDVE